MLAAGARLHAIGLCRGGKHVVAMYQVLRHAVGMLSASSLTMPAPHPPARLQEEHETDLELLKEADMLRSVRMMRTALVVQDCADALMALHDITGEQRWAARSELAACGSFVWSSI